MSLSSIDWVIIVGYCLFAVSVGIYFAGRAGKDTQSFFISSRNLPWWLAGTSMVATSFASDTPLAITGLVAKHGIAGNWLWWSFALSSLMTVFFFSRLWRRAGVMTDIELTELRYGGKGAATLRGFKALYMAIPINCITMGWVILAMAKIFDVALGWPRIQSVVLCVAIALLYSILSGLWGVVTTDLLQFVLAMIGSIVLAFFAIEGIGGVDNLIISLREAGRVEGGVMNFYPAAGPFALPLMTFMVYLGIQWWANLNADGGGIIIQRILSTRDERNSFLSTLWFCIAHYALRPWPWIIVALVSLVVYPDLSDPEMGYPKMMVEYLPTGLRGIMVASFLAAFMSTIDTHLNWGASYLVNDFYRRFLARNRDEKHYVLVSRLCLLVMVSLAAVFSYLMGSISEAWKFLWSVGSGVGLVLILRWFWWRINAWSEIAAMSASMFATIMLTLYSPFDYGLRLVLVVLTSLVVWVIVTFLTSPVDDKILVEFYQRVRPAGAWRRIAKAGGKVETLTIRSLLLNWLLGAVFLYTLMFGIGVTILGPVPRGLLLVVFSMVLFYFMWRRARF
jgi:Na+/proline symporter